MDVDEKSNKWSILWIIKHKNETKPIHLQFLFSVCSECSRLFHKGGARLILCGSNWDKLESLYDSLTNDADPKEVRKL